MAAPAAALAGPGTPLTAEEAIEIQRDQVREATGTAPCARGSADGDIIVCGRRGADPNRLPLPVERLPGAREHLLPGELPRAQSRYDTCVIACPKGGGINLLLLVRAAPEIVRHVLGDDDE